MARTTTRRRLSQPTRRLDGGSYSASLRVTDASGASDTASVAISVGNRRLTAVINAPSAGTTWKVGDRIDFSGSDRCAGRHAASLRVVVEVDPASLPVELPHA